MEIVSYLQGIGLSVEPEGRGWKVKTCAFCGHNDCFKVSPEGFFKCFSCNVAGDAFKFESLRQGISYQQAKQNLTGATIIAMPDPERERAERNHQRLVESQEYLSWISERRKINVDVINKFKVGCFVAEDGKVHYSFPYFDGQTVPNVKYRTADKRIYFKKGGTEFLFNRNALRNANRVLVVEGELDCLSAYTYRLNIPCVSVGLGAGSFKHGWRNDFADIEHILIGFDNDDAGRSGAIKLAELLGHERCRIVRWPDTVKDLNEALTQGLAKEDIEECISRSLLMDQVEIFQAIEAISPDEPVIGEKIKGVLKLIAERPSAEIEDYIRAIRQRFPELSYRQILDFRSQIKTIRHFSKDDEVKDSAQDALEIPEDIKADAIKLLSSPDIIETIQEWLTDIGIVGEDLNKICLWLFFLSRKMDQQIHTHCYGQSSSGKSLTVKKVLSTIPDEDVMQFTSLSAHALDYREDQSLIGKVIFVEEADGSDEVDYVLRIAMSEQRLIRGYTVKDPETGDLKNMEKVTEVKSCFVVTTTRAQSNNENATRVWSLYADESIEQTKKVIEHLKKTQSREYRLEEPNRRKKIDILKAAQRLLKPIEVEVPYAHLLEFDSSSTTRNRRDFGRLIQFIKVIAFLRQFQKPVLVDSAGSFIQADLYDYQIAHTLIQPILRNTLEEITPRGIAILEVSCVLQSELRKDSLLEDCDDSFTVKQIQGKALEVGVDCRNVVNLRSQLEQLCDQEHLQLVSGAWGQRGSRHRFKVLSKFSIENGRVSNIQTSKQILLPPSELSVRFEQYSKK